MSAAVDALKAQWRTPNGRAVLIACAIMLALAPFNFILMKLFGWSAFWPFRSWALGDLPSLADSWRVMIQAYDWLKAHPGGNVYDAIFFEQGVRFQYAPTSLLPLALLDMFGITPTPALFDVFNRVVIAVTAAGVGALAWRAFDRLGMSGEDLALRRKLAAGAAIAACLQFYPTIMGYHLGQAQVWINALFVFACFNWLVGRKLAAGILIGLICLLKPQFGLFVLWGGLRREWRFLAGMIATGVIGLALSILAFGFDNHLHYLSVLQFLSRHGEAYWANQSFNGLTHRLLGHSPGADWDPNSFAPYDPIVYGVTLITTLGILVAALWTKRGSSPIAGLLDFELAALAFTMASPIAWEHHYGVMIAMFATLFILFLSQTPSEARARQLIALAAAFLVAGACWTFTRAWTMTPFNLAQSYVLFAGLGVMFMLRRRLAA